MESETSDDPLIGTVIGDRYLIEAKLGKGAMGVVYRARHVKMTRRFAVKLLHPHLLANAKLRRRFEREAELAGNLQHENVVNVVDIGETNGQHYLVMEFAEGPSLQELLVEAPFPPARILTLARQLCNGLHHAHQHGVIHRDFKPDNIIIERQPDGSETPRIVDFGIARLVEEAPTHHGRLTTDGLVLGTPEYMAPEQAMNNQIDLRIDLFALGVILYELLCGKLPFDGTGVEVALANVTREPPAMSARAPGVAVDPLLEALTRKLLAKKPEQRPASARAVGRILEQIESDRPAAAAQLGVELSAPARPTASARGLSEMTSVDDVEPPAPLREFARHPSTIAVAAVKQAQWRWMAIGAAVVVAIGLVLVVALRPSKAPAAEPPREVAAVAPVVAPVVVPPVAPVVDAAVVAEAVVASPPVPPAPVVKRAPVAPKPAVRPVVNPTPKPAPAPAPAEPASASALAALYTTIGQELKALRERAGADVTSDLWRRYLLIHLNEAMTSPARRGAAMEVLGQIRHEASQIRDASNPHRK